MRLFRVVLFALNVKRLGLQVVKKSTKVKARKNLQAMRTRQHKNRMRADKVKGVEYKDWFEQQVEELK